MIDTNKMPWQSLREHVQHKPLARDDGRNFQIDIVQLAPETKYPSHVHPDIEWVYVLKGSCEDENGVWKEGYFHVNEKGSFHALKTGKDGCELLVCWCGELAQ